ncbi:uncharacterized protein LOC108734800 [Agrilus planipennis]|uniref:Uncharacterized protein LOC108734800 n=1 Tax=Agrilus planipennis TaxID=224129 RepID=A0A1W4WNE2_AGRPL|nr:uncharacterized protein LOC108734800 [Agrilus planipennis]
MLNVSELIEEVKQRPLLWDRSATVDGPESITTTRDELWQEIATKLQITKDQGRTKWKMLRDTYRKLIFKKLHIRKWRYMKEMEFLRETLLTAPWNKAKPRTQIRIKTESVDDDAAYVTDTVITDPLQYPETNDMSQEDFTQNSSLNQEIKSKVFGGSVPHRERTEKIVWMAAQDHDLQFLLSLHGHFKEIPPHRKLPLRMKIEELILEEIYKRRDNEMSES